MLTVHLLAQSLHGTRDKLGGSPMTHCMDRQENTWAGEWVGRWTVHPQPHERAMTDTNDLNKFS